MKADEILDRAIAERVFPGAVVEVASIASPTVQGVYGAASMPVVAAAPAPLRAAPSSGSLGPGEPTVATGSPEATATPIGFLAPDPAPARPGRAPDRVALLPPETRTGPTGAWWAIRIDPAGAYGPFSCIAGFVWREAYPGDAVCVTPARRTAVARENAEAPLHRTRG